jgi:hypothetical protein
MKRKDDGPIHLGGPEFDRICKESIDGDIAMSHMFPDLMRMLGIPQTAQELFETNLKMAKTRKALEQIRRRIGR